MKRIAAILFALAMVFSCGFVAMADTTAQQNGSITIKGDTAAGVSIAGKTFSAYRLFDMSAQNTEGDSSYDIYGSYTYSASWVNDFFKTIDASYNNNPAAASLYVSKLSNSEMQAFAQSIRTYILGHSVTATGSVTAGASADTVTISNLPIGYYVVLDLTLTDTTTISACMINYTKPNTEIVLKANNIPDLKKQAYNQDVTELYKAVGTVIPFDLLSKVPDATNYKSYILKFSDSMSDGLTFAPTSLKITIGTAVYVYHAGSFFAEDDTTFSTAIGSIGYTAKANGFEIQLTLKSDYDTTVLYNKGASIRVDYNATVNENAIAGQPDANGATLTYTNNPDGSTATTPPRIIKVYTVQFDITKVDGDKKLIKTSPATFELYGPETAKAGTGTTTIDGKTYYDYGSFSTTDGALTIEGLAPGTYYLRETKAPDGYNLLTTDIKIEITEGTEGAVTYKINGDAGSSASVGHVAFQVENTAGLNLPATGGIGTLIFTVGGCTILLIAGLFLVLNRKKIFGK